MGADGTSEPLSPRFVSKSPGRMALVKALSLALEKGHLFGPRELGNGLACWAVHALAQAHEVSKCPSEAAKEALLADDPEHGSPFGAPAVNLASEADAAELLENGVVEVCVRHWAALEVLLTMTMSCISSHYSRIIHA